MNCVITGLVTDCSCDSEAPPFCSGHTDEKMKSHTICQIYHGLLGSKHAIIVF